MIFSVRGETFTRIEDDTAPGGAYLEWATRSGNVVEVVDIVVSDRRQGTGRRLVDELVKLLRDTDVRTIYAFTRASNGGARAFWGAVGFDLMAAVPGFYPEDGDEGCGVLLTREIR